jgi:hypothetical protein
MFSPGLNQQMELLKKKSKEDASTIKALEEYKKKASKVCIR